MARKEDKFQKDREVICCKGRRSQSETLLYNFFTKVVERNEEAKKGRYEEARRGTRGILFTKVVET